jgi:lipid A 3-O-deacylase
VKRVQVVQVRRTVWLLVALWVAGLVASRPVYCADLPPAETAASLPAVVPAVPVSVVGDPGDQFEGRFGAFAAGIGSAEQGTVDLNASFLTPRLHLGLQGYWAYLLPRLQLGGAVNLDGRTSFGYADIALTLPIAWKFFFEPFLGGAIHNGSLTPTPTLSGLGCPVLFHAGASFGVAITEHWNVLGTFEHLSNGVGLGINCGTNHGPTGNVINQGLNNYGVRIGYAF